MDGAGSPLFAFLIPAPHKRELLRQSEASTNAPFSDQFGHNCAEPLGCRQHLSNGCLPQLQPRRDSIKGVCVKIPLAGFGFVRTDQHYRKAKQQSIEYLMHFEAEDLRHVGKRQIKSLQTHSSDLSPHCSPEADDA